MVSLLGTASHYEREVPAEYDLTEHTDRKILVIVHQPAWLDAKVNLRYHLTEAINENLVRSVRIPPEQLVSYGELSEFRSNRDDFSLLSPVQVGKALDANLVLLVTLEDYQLQKIADTNYYKGFLGSRAVLLDTATEAKLWPKWEKSKSIKVGFEIESHGRLVAVKRQAAASAHCIVRYLYNCPENQFKIADDRSGIAWKSWKK